MAEAAKVQEKSLEELKGEITCGICQEHYTEPKILPCLHYYCKQCVLRLAHRTETKKAFSCPECRSPATLPEGGVDKLKTAFFINRLKSKVSALERSHGKVEVWCELCEGSSNSARAFCRQCARFICQECVDLHKRITTFKSHKVATLDDLKHGRAKPVPVQEAPTEKCLVHEEPLTIYCYDCDRLVCRDCTLKDHREHNFEFSKKAAPAKKNKLLEEVKPLKDLHMKLTNAVENIQMTKAEIETQRDSTINIIKASFKELHAILDKHEKELVEKTRAAVQDKVDKLLVQEKTLSLASAEVRSAVDYTERSARHCTDNEVMSTFSEMRKTIRQKVQEHSKLEWSLEPVEEANMGVEVRCAEALKQLCQTQANVIKLSVDPSKCTVQLEESAEVGQLSTGTLTTRLNNNKQTKRNCKVTSQLRSLHNGAITDCNIVEDGSERYSIQYTPTVRGRHELMISVDGQHVAGSPFSVFVFIPPTQLGRPVKVWKGISEPNGITVNSKGDILVCEEKGSIVKLGVNGTVEKLVAQTGLTVLIGIAVDDEDNIYCIDNESDQILMCDKKGRNIRTHQVKLEGGDGRLGLGLSNNYLFISERGYKDIILVYNRDLTYVRCIRHRGMGIVRAISSDVHGNIYATSYSSCTVQVFNANGNFLRSLHNKPQLKGPTGVCVLGPHIYVAANHSILVFTTDGVFITSFGQLGSKDGEFMAPKNLCTNNDGFLYICDKLNNRIQCF